MVLARDWLGIVIAYPAGQSEEFPEFDAISLPSFPVQSPISKSQLLCQLSYTPQCCLPERNVLRKMARVDRLRTKIACKTKRQQEALYLVEKGSCPGYEFARTQTVNSTDAKTFYPHGLRPWDWGMGRTGIGSRPLRSRDPIPGKSSRAPPYNPLGPQGPRPLQLGSPNVRHDTTWAVTEKESRVPPHRR